MSVISRDFQARAGASAPPAVPASLEGAGGDDYLSGIARVRAALEAHAALDPEAPPPPAPHPLPDLGPEGSGSTLLALCRRFGLSPFERDVLLLAAGMELDATFAPLCARAQVDPRREYPTFGLALAALPGASWQALLPDAPLRYWQLVRLAPGGGLTTSELSIDERILHYLLGLDCRDERLAGLLEPVLDGGELVPSHAALAAQVARTWERTRGGADFPVVELCGEDLGSKWALATAACGLLGWRLYSLAAEALPTAAAELDNLLRLWHRETILAPAALLLAGDDLRPDEPHEAALRRFVDQAHGALLVTRRRRLPPRHRPLLSLEVAKPALAEQLDEWRRLLATFAAGAESADGAEARAMGDSIEGLADHFNLHAAEIRSACFEAIGKWSGEEGNGSAKAALGAALWETCRSRARPALVDLAEHLEPRAGWDDLVLPEAQRQILREIVSHVRRRGLVYRGWGFDRKTARGSGVSVLFGGPSGTGKTLAAEVMAAELDLDLYRIDLSSVVSKYIGETEKNLQRIFDAAEAGGTILLFDEADALFGKRSEVKDSHDRYANLEVSYLLQRMETYRGLAILTTNMPDSLDSAFKRRLRFIVEFPFPDLAQRRELWRRVFPSSAPTEGLDYDRLARLNVAGGHVRNIALHAAFLAAEAGRAVTMRDLLGATRRELAKAGRALSDAEVRDWVGGCRGSAGGGRSARAGSRAAPTWSRIFLESSAKETAMGKLPIRRSQASARTPALPVSSPLAAPAAARRKPTPVAAQGPSLQRAALLGHSVQRVAAGLIQPKLTLGPVADSYEHEADSVAQQVMQHISSPAAAEPAAPAPEAASPAPATAQRALPEDELKKKPLPGAVQRVAPEDELKKKPLASAVQRAPEDELKMKPLPGSLQRAPEDELKMKPLPGAVQRVAPEDELKKKPLPGAVQRSGAGIEGGPIGADLERSIEGARSGGSALDAGLRVQMEPAFGADFSGVRVHSDSQSHQLNQSLQARAFTTGQDIFFRGGEYQPQSSAGKELIAHELTHVVQQGGSAVTKKTPA